MRKYRFPKKIYETITKKLPKKNQLFEDHLIWLTILLYKSHIDKTDGLAETSKRYMPSDILSSIITRRIQTQIKKNLSEWNILNIYENKRYSEHHNSIISCYTDYTLNPFNTGLFESKDIDFVYHTFNDKSKKKLKKYFTECKNHQINSNPKYKKILETMNFTLSELKHSDKYLQETLRISYTSIDNYSGRFHNSFVNLKKYLRNELTLNTRKLYNWDISNSQWVMLLIAMKEFNDIYDYQDNFLTFENDIISGMIYDKMSHILNITRDETKKKSFVYLFGLETNKHDREFEKALNQLYKIKHRMDGFLYHIREITKIELPRLLQKIEKDLIMDTINETIEKIKVKYFLTIHDSIYSTSKTFLRKTMEIIKQKIYNLIGKKPILKINI